MQWSLRVIALYICVFTPVTLVTAGKCDTCKDMVQKFQEGLKKTAKSNFGGGNTRWEEERLGSFAFSETRFVEIQETLCSKSSSECNAMLEEHEETLEDWWFKQYAKNTGVELHQYFCIDNVKVCCPNNTYGPKCLECPGGTERPCQGRGSCDGAGTREGKGTCKCDWGYQGELCDDCKDDFFEQARNDTTVTCSSCHRSCKKTCTEAGATGCDECKEGWESDEEVGCKDIDECAAETSPCSDNEYCSNNEGSYACKDCHISCKGCTGSGSENCVECNEGFTKGDEDNCFDIDECTEGAQCTGENEKCVNEPGTYKCECEEGFIRQDDKCILKPRDPPKPSKEGSKGKTKVKKGKKKKSKENRKNILRLEYYKYWIILLSFTLAGILLMNKPLAQSLVTIIVWIYLYWFCIRFDKLKRKDFS